MKPFDKMSPAERINYMGNQSSFLNRFWVTACDANRVVIVNQYIDVATWGDAAQWASEMIEPCNHASIVITLHSRGANAPYVSESAPVSLAKPDAPECVAVLHPVEQESNAVVMARAVAVVRDRRLTAEYVAVKDGEKCACEVGPEWSGSPHPADPDNAWECDDCGRRIEAENEQDRALAAEQARADAARKLAGKEF